MSGRRFEFVDPSINARKFWEIELNGSKVTTIWGRIGAAPAQKTKDFGSPARAKAEADKLVKEKLKKGYKSVGKDTLDEPLHKRPLSGGSKKPGKKAGKDKSKKPDKLTTDQINWLAKHGWSSAQIKDMSVAEALRHIKAGKNKKAGPDTEAALKGDTADEKALAEYKDGLLKTGFVALVKPNGDAGLAAICDRVMQIDGNEAAKRMLSLGRFSDGERAFLVIPSDKECAREFCLGIAGARYTMRDAEVDKGIGIWMVEAVEATCKKFKLDEDKMWRGGEDRVGHGKPTW